MPGLLCGTDNCQLFDPAFPDSGYDCCHKREFAVNACFLQSVIVLYFQPSAAMKRSAERMKEIVMKIPIACLDSSVGKRRMPAQSQQWEPAPMLVAALRVSIKMVGV